MSGDDICKTLAPSLLKEGMLDELRTIWSDSSGSAPGATVKEGMLVVGRTERFPSGPSYATGEEDVIRDFTWALIERVADFSAASVVKWRERRRLL